MVKLNQRAMDHAARLIKEGRVVKDQRDAWSGHKPSTEEENEFIRQHGLGEYGRWHLGIDDDGITWTTFSPDGHYLASTSS